MNRKAVVMALVSILAVWILVFACVSCTYSINMAHVDGEASDVIDEQDEPKADAQITVPVSVPALPTL